jgi:hypothetical protein
VTALSIRLTLDHGGLPAGTTIDVGYAEAVAHAEPPPVVEPQTVSTPTTSTLPEPKPSTVPTETEAAPAETAPAPTTETETRVEPEPEPTTTEELPPKPRPLPEPEPPPGLFPLPEELQPTLDGGPYVFPVFGESSYVDTYGAARADVSYHHGADIFGELGQLEQGRRQPPLGARPPRERLLLRAPLRVLDARLQRRPRPGGSGRRVHGQHR